MRDLDVVDLIFNLIKFRLQLNLRKLNTKYLFCKYHDFLCLSSPMRYLNKNKKISVNQIRRPFSFLKN